MNDVPDLTAEQLALRALRLIWLPELWPANERRLWLRGCNGMWPEGRDNPATDWRPRTVEKNGDGYGCYLAWLYRQGVLIEEETIEERVTAERLAGYIADLKARVSPVSVGAMVGGLAAAVQAMAPTHDWSWLRRRATRMKLKAKASREKRRAVRHTIDLYRFGITVMDTAGTAAGPVAAAQRYQAGLIIALLAARPLRIRNFQAITIGESLRWDGRRYWLTFATDETKMRMPIDEPLPDDLRPYLEAFLLRWRPVLLRQTQKFGGTPIHRRLWVDIYGKPMGESTLRETIKRYTRKEFGTAVWPHLFRDCLLTSVAVDQPNLMQISAALLGHTSTKTGEKHYNQARMIDASRRYGEAISELRHAMLSAPANGPGPMEGTVEHRGKRSCN
jgi:hypothetical protein